MCRCTCGHVTFSGGIRNLIVFGDISFKIQCTRLVLIGYKNVTGDIQKYVKIIMKNGFCNVKFCFGIALSKTGRPSSTHALRFLPLRAFKPSSSESADRGRSIIQVNLNRNYSAILATLQITSYALGV